MVEPIFLSPQPKGNVIIKKTAIYELSHELPKDLRLVVCQECWFWTRFLEISFQRLENLNLENQAVCKTFIALHEIDTNKIIVVKGNFSFFSMHYISEKEKKLPRIPRIEIKCPYVAVNRGLNDKNFLDLDGKPKMEEIFYVIRQKINQLEPVKKKGCLSFCKHLWCLMFQKRSCFETFQELCSKISMLESFVNNLEDFCVSFPRTSQNSYFADNLSTLPFVKRSSTGDAILWIFRNFKDTQG